MPENNSLRLSKLRLRNFRCFGTMSEALELDPRLTVLVAKNGSGKTAVLNALRISLGTFTRAAMALSQANIKKSDATLPPFSVVNSAGAHYPVAIVVEGVVDSQAQTWKRELLNAHGRTTSKDAKVITDYGVALMEAVREGRVETDLPIIAFYGTGRLWGDETADVLMSDYKFAEESRFSGYDDALTANSIYVQVKRWMAYAAKVRGNAAERDTAHGQTVVRQYEAVVRAVDLLLRGSGFDTLHYSYTYGDLAVMDHHCAATDGQSGAASVEIPVSWTSDGVKAAVSLVADIAYRCIRLNPHRGDDACRLTQGIVLIDEVDMFLHPSWQQHFLSDLCDAFPLIQFVVTTHSPQIVSSVSASSIRIITEDTRIVQVDKTEGVESSRVLERVFGTEAYPSRNPWRTQLAQYIKDVYEGRWDEPAVRQMGEALSAYFAGVDVDFDTARLHVENEEWEREHASN